MRKPAFTLLEFFIMILVIVIISVITVPIAYRNTQKREYTNGLKAFYKTASIATQKYLIDQKKSLYSDLSYGKINTSNTYPEYSEESVDDTLGPLVRNYFKPMKICGTNLGDICYGKQKIIYLGNSYAITPDLSENLYRFRTLGGMFVAIRPFKHTINMYNVDSLDYKNYITAEIMVDTNGPLRPNAIGKDVFFFNLTNSGELIPFGYVKSAPKGRLFSYWKETCDSIKQSGMGCAGRILEEDWQMNYL